MWRQKDRKSDERVHTIWKRHTTASTKEKFTDIIVFFTSSWFTYITIVMYLTIRIHTQTNWFLGKYCSSVLASEIQFIQFLFSISRHIWWQNFALLFQISYSYFFHPFSSTYVSVIYCSQLNPPDYYNMLLLYPKGENQSLKIKRRNYIKYIVKAVSQCFMRSSLQLAKRMNDDKCNSSVHLLLRNTICINLFVLPAHRSAQYNYFHAFGSLKYLHWLECLLRIDFVKNK